MKKAWLVFPLPRGSFLVDPSHPVIAGDVKDKTKSLFAGEHTAMPEWKETFYALIIPKGYVATGMHLSLTGSLPDATPERDFTLRVLPFPLPVSYETNWLGVIFGQTATTTTLEKDTPFFGKNQHLLGLQLLENHGIVDRWQVTVQLKKDVAEPEIATPMPDPDAEGALLAQVKLGADGRSVETMPQYIKQAQPKQKLALAEDGSGSLWLVGVKGELYAGGADLWASHSEDGGKHWSEAEPMPVNSASAEFAPTLIRAEDGSLQLFFLSNRRGLGWEIWTSTLGKKSRRWSHPSLIPVRDYASTGFESDNSNTQDILPYAVMQDSHGKWLLAVYCGGCGKLLMLESDDLTHWQLRSSRETEMTGALALGQDSSDRYYLVSVNFAGNASLYLSNDAAKWEFSGMMWKKYPNPHSIATYPITLLKQKDEGMVMLFSDIYTGLQYARLAPLTNILPDLVTQNRGLSLMQPPLRKTASLPPYGKAIS